MEVAEKFNSLIQSLNSAFADFQKSLQADFSKYDEQEIDWIKNAQIQKFEFCIELTWKTAKVFLDTVEQKTYTPKLVAKDLFLHQIIDENMYLSFMSCIEDRNKFSHMYKLDMFEIVVSELPNYANTLNHLVNRLNAIRI